MTYNRASMFQTVLIRKLTVFFSLAVLKGWNTNFFSLLQNFKYEDFPFLNKRRTDFRIVDVSKSGFNKPYISLTKLEEEQIFLEEVM